MICGLIEEMLESLRLLFGFETIVGRAKAEGLDLREFFGARSTGGANLGLRDLFDIIGCLILPISEAPDEVLMASGLCLPSARAFGDDVPRTLDLFGLVAIFLCGDEVSSFSWPADNDKDW